MNSPGRKRSHVGTARVDLVLSGTGHAPWQLGDTLTVMPGSACLGMKHESLQSTSADAILFWDSALGQPSGAQVLKTLADSSDLWHTGLCLGMRGLPRLVDFVNPTWMFNCDPDPGIVATSWRVSLLACLVRTDVLRKMGFLRPEFSTIEAAVLEWGHRLLAHGVIMRHVPKLLPAYPALRRSVNAPTIPFVDELRFVYYRHGRKWAAWAVFRALISRYTTLSTALLTWRKVMCTARPPEQAPYRASNPVSLTAADEKRAAVKCDLLFKDSSLKAQLSIGDSHSRVSVLIPTVDRYSYLRTLLDQLRRQTVQPCEIIIVDQTITGQRDLSLARDFADLPLRIITQNEAGQCTSRNAGLQIMGGDCILFIDDDDEIAPDLIERHLKTLAEFDADSSSGIADEVGAERHRPAPGMLRCSDGFPTNNTLAKRAALEKAGLFDLAYNRGQRADGDLGMRMYLIGAVMVLNTDISVLHHHAPSGGLRKHKARVITYASSRNRLLHRSLPSATEFYLGLRYFSKTQVRETIWLRILGTFSTKGGYFRRAIKISLSAILLPHTMWVIRKSWKSATEMLATFPIIPRLSPQPRESEGGLPYYVDSGKSLRGPN